MSVQVLISTMYQKNYDLLDRMCIMSDAVVVNQCESDEIQVFQHKNHTICWVDSTERGISRSRNMAIRNASADYCLISDDDEVLVQGYPRIIEEALGRNPRISVLRFRVEGIERKFKDYPVKENRIGYIRAMKTSSVEICFRRKDIVENELLFDNLIGSGSMFNHGEENSFLFQCLTKGLKIRYVPVTIAKLHIGKSTWFDGYNKKYFFGSGAAFTSMSRCMSFVLILQFGVRRYKLFKNEHGFFLAIKHMLEGRREYIRLVKKG